MTARHLDPVPDDDGHQAPPSDLAAERATLGGMLISRNAIDDCLELVTAPEFYRPAHELIFTAIANLHLAGEPADAITVADELTRTGDLRRAGGAAYIHDLASAVPVAASAGYYAQIVSEKAAMRRLVEAGTRITQLGYAASGGDIDGLYQAATRELEQVGGYLPADTDKPAPGENIDELLHGEDEEYDWLIPDFLERGDRMIVTAGEGMGKALALDTPLLTTRGWTTMGDIAAGDEIFTPNGTPARVVGATDVMHDRPCYRVTFSDGESIVADAEHLWLTENYQSRSSTAKAWHRPDETKRRGTDQRHKRKHFPAIVTTEQIRDTLWARGGHTLNHSVPTTAPLQHPTRLLPVDPYVLGVWLGDGTTASGSITSADQQIIHEVAAIGYGITRRTAKYLFGVTGLQVQLRAIGVLGNKHIPEDYLRGSVAQRLALLQGLMDSDGTADTKGSCEFSVTHERLAADTHELLLSLGIKVTNRQSNATLNGRVIGPRWRMQFLTDLPVFRLARKADRLTPRPTARHRLRYITAVEPVTSVPVRCIQIENEDGMYLAGRALIPTHNSTFMRQVAVQAASGLHPFDPTRAVPPIRVLIVDLENSRRQTRRKIRPLRVQAGHHLDPARLVIECKVDGLDLTTAADQQHLDRMIRHHQPDMLITGPIYKLANGNPNDEVDAKPIAMFLDKMRAEHGIAVLLEAHSKKGEGGKNRPKEPFGWSGWMRWPEFGIHLGEEGEVSHWRGARDERDIPHQLKRGGVWPWMPASSLADQRWIAIRDAIRAAGRKLTQREMADATGINTTSVNAVVREHTADLASLYYELEAQ